MNNSPLNHLTGAKKIEYLTLDRTWKIVEYSSQINLFADSSEPVRVGKDCYEYFPELVELENVFTDLLEDRVSHFFLKNVCIESPEFSVLYRDIHAFKNIPLETDLAGDILIIFEESTQQSWQEQKLSQIIKAHDYTISYLHSGLHPEYLEPIANSLIDFLIITNEEGRIEFINSAAKNCLEFFDRELLNQPISIIFKDSEITQSLNLLNLDNTSQLLKNIPVNCQTKSGLEMPISFSCSSLYDPSQTQQKFIWIGRDISEQQYFDRQLRQQVEQTRFLENITQRIRQSLRLEAILKTTITEIQQFLQTDRIYFYQIYTDKAQQLRAEAIVSSDSINSNTSILEQLITRDLFTNLSQGKVCYLPNIRTTSLSEDIKHQLSQSNIMALLIIPILTHTPSQQPLWGTLMMTHQTPYPSRWETWKINLLEQFASQLTNTIQQAQLYEELQQKNQELERLSVTDGLTQISNRYNFNQTLEQEWRRLGREAAPLSLILADIDDFKQYNDIYGYPAGDACLQLIASVLKDTVKRPADKVARYGTNEFALILPNTNESGALLVAKSILNRIKALKIPHESSTVADHVTMSIGVATLLPTQLSTSEALIQMVDRALLTAKQHGKDRIFAISED